jgi:hypothetical protein
MSRGAAKPVTCGAIVRGFRSLLASKEDARRLGKKR